MIQQNAERKHWSNSESGLHADAAIEALHYLLWDDEAKTDTTSVHAARVRNLAEELEQLWLVLLLDAGAGVNDWDDDLVMRRVRLKDVLDTVLSFEFHLLVILVIWVLAVVFIATGCELLVVAETTEAIVFLYFATWLAFDELSDDFYVSTLLCKLDGIRLQVQKDLFDAFLFRVDHMVLVLDWNLVSWPMTVSQAFLDRKVDKIRCDSDTFGYSLIYLNVDYFFHGSLDIERLGILRKAIVLNLCIAENILNL